MRREERAVEEIVDGLQSLEMKDAAKGIDGWLGLMQFSSDRWYVLFVFGVLLQAAPLVGEIGANKFLKVSARQRNVLHKTSLQFIKALLYVLFPY